LKNTVLVYYAFVKIGEEKNAHRYFCLF